MLRESRGAGAGSGRTSRRGFPAPVGTGRERSLAGRRSVPVILPSVSLCPRPQRGRRGTRGPGSLRGIHFIVVGVQRAPFLI